MSEEKLVRGLGRWDFTAIVINTIIGAGIFGLPARVYAQIGAYSLIAFVVCALIIGLVVLCYAEVSSRFSATGGPYLYAREAFGSVVGFEVGWLYWIVRVTTFAANCNLLVTYLGFFVPSANEGWLRIGFIGLVVLIITVVNLNGIRESALMTNIFTAGKLIPLIIFACVGMFFIQPTNFDFASVPEYSSFSKAVLLLIYAFLGFEAAVVLAGETKTPERTIPFGTIAGLCIVAVLYIMVQTVSIGTLPELASSERPLADAAAIFLGSFGAAFITLGALVSIFGNLNVGILSSTRIIFAMSEQRDLPRFFEKTHRRFKTPHVAIVFTGIVILVLTIQSSFLTALTIATITRLLVYATTCLALPVLRWSSESNVSKLQKAIGLGLAILSWGLSPLLVLREILSIEIIVLLNFLTACVALLSVGRTKTIPEAQFRVPFGIIAALLSLALIGWLLTNVDFAKEGLAILVAAALGLIIFACFRLFGRSTNDAMSGKAES